MEYSKDPSNFGHARSFESAQAANIAARAATVAPLGRNEKDPAAGERRRRNVASMLGVAGGIGSVVVMKSAATATALWLGAPALGVVAVGALATMAAAGSVGYFSQRAALKRAGQDVPPFSFGGLFKSMFTSKPALMAGSMTALAAVMPAAGMLALGSAVAAIGAGLHEYNSQRAERRAAGEDVGRFSLREMFSTINHSKGAKKAFLISAGLGAALAGVMAATGVTFAPVDTQVAAVADVPVPAVAPVPQDYVGHYDIQRGDTLWDISKQLLGGHGTNAQIVEKVHEIAALNGIENADYVRAGDTIDLPLADVAPADLAKIQDSLRGMSVESAPNLDAQLAEGKSELQAAHEKAAAAKALAPAPAAPAPVVSATAPVVAAPVIEAPQIPAVGECFVYETDTALKMDCKMDPDAVVQPGSSIEFRAAAQPEPFRVSLSETSAPMSAQEFLANHAVPEAEEAFSNGRFTPKP